MLNPVTLPALDVLQVIRFEQSCEEKEGMEPHCIEDSTTGWQSWKEDLEAHFQTLDARKMLIVGTPCSPPSPRKPIISLVMRMSILLLTSQTIA
ncbi:Kelch domain-containing protein 4 [Manis javanica]|nr:Kelch domain-containing protein 4 [Manis javanica]